MTLKDFMLKYYGSEEEYEIENGEVIGFVYDWFDDRIFDEYVEAMNYERTNNSVWGFDQLYLYSKILLYDAECSIRYHKFIFKKEIEEQKTDFDMIAGLQHTIEHMEWNKKKLMKYSEELEKDLLNNVSFEFNSINEPQKKSTMFKKHKKLIWNDTEENLLILIEKLINSGLIDSSCWKERYAIIRDTFLNKNLAEFKSKQLSVTNIRTDLSKKIESTNFKKFFDNLKTNF